MINEEKVRIMTRCATYEKHHGRTDLPIAGFFKSDYVKFNIWKTLLAVLMAFLILTGIFVVGYYEEIFEELNQLHFKKMAILLVAVLLLLLVVYYFIARILYIRRFERVRKGVASYYRDLKRLKEFYDKDGDDSPKMFEERGAGAQNDEFIDY